MTIVVRQDCLKSADGSLGMPEDEYEYYGQDWEDTANAGVEGDFAEEHSKQTCPASDNVYASILKAMEGEGEHSKAAAAASGANKSVRARKDDGPFEVRSLHTNCAVLLELI